jgi:hypothetical protein
VSKGEGEMSYVITASDVVVLVLCFVVVLGSCSLVGASIWRWRHPTKEKEVEVPRRDFKPFTFEVKKTEKRKKI